MHEASRRERATKFSRITENPGGKKNERKTKMMVHCEWNRMAESFVKMIGLNLGYLV